LKNVKIAADVSGADDDDDATCVNGSKTIKNSGGCGVSASTYSTTRRTKALCRGEEERRFKDG